MSSREVIRTMSRMTQSNGRFETISRRNCLKATTASLAALVGIGTGTAAKDDPEASVTFYNQSVGNEQLTVASTEMEKGGFVTMHDTRLLDGVGAGSIIGVSEYLDPGKHENVTVPLFNEPLETDKEELRENQILIAVPHLDTNENQEFDFLPSDPGQDVAYTEGPQAIGGLPNDGVNDIAWVTVA